MSYNIEALASFQRAAKKLIKKYPSLKEELKVLGEQLSLNPELGSPIGNSCYKIRLQITSKGKGKSGGARVITHVYVHQETVYLLTIYDKSSRETISNKELLELLKFIE